MIRPAMEIWCSGIPSRCMPPKVMATESGMAAAMTMAERQSISRSATRTTISTASMNEEMKSAMRWCTDSGWLEIAAISTPAGSWPEKRRRHAFTAS